MHAQVIWCFHENTNAEAASRASVPAKIRPPRCHGAKVGCLSTRSPHRPNAIGLSVVRVEGVSRAGIDVSCLDMVDGTPVLDGE
jgi:tRNA (Thr-GGU) A37 N-methylase